MLKNILNFLKSNIILTSLCCVIIYVIFATVIRLTSPTAKIHSATILENQTYELQNEDETARIQEEKAAEAEKARLVAEEKAKQQAEAKKQAELKKQQEEQAKKLAEAQKKQQSLPASTAAVTTQPPKPQPKLIDSLPLSNSRQAIIVKGTSTSGVNITFEAYEKDSNNVWQLKYSTSGVVGRNGMSSNRHEGDMTTPMGIYGFVFEFGRANNPGTKMEYRQTVPGDLWISNPNNLNEYNVWTHYDGNDAKSRFGDYEDLYSTSVYKYAATLDFNYGSGKVMGKGSGIFLHIAPYTGKGTLGCIGIPEAKLVEVLKWMDPNKNPKIIIGTDSYLKGLK